MEFNNISNFIFGSQVTLLVQLSSTRNPITTTQTQSIFNQAKSTFSTIHEGRTLNEWLRYLITNNLVIQEDETIQITQYGTDFLKHLLDARLAYERPG